MSQNQKKIARDLAIVFFVFSLSVSSAFIPGFDLVKALVLALAMSGLYLYQARARTREEETDRYRRVAREVFPVRLEEDAAHLSNLLLGGDIPYKWLGWMSALLG